MTVEYITQDQIDRSTKSQLVVMIANLRSELTLRDSELASLRSQLANRGMVE